MRYWRVEREEIDSVLAGESRGGLHSGPRPWCVVGNGYQGQGCGSVDCEGVMEEGTEDILREGVLDWGSGGGGPLGRYV